MIVLGVLLLAVAPYLFAAEQTVGRRAARLWATASPLPDTPASPPVGATPAYRDPGSYLLSLPMLLREYRDPSEKEGGVPRYLADYTQDVETWWASHPLNPANPEGIPIGEIENLEGLPTINVRQHYGSDLQAAIDALPAKGGTLVLDPGVYDGFRIIGRNNIHIVSDGGAIIRNAGSGPVDDRGSNKIAGCPQALDYGTFNACAFWNDPDCLSCLRRRAGNIYFKNITFDGAGVAVEAVGLHAVRGVVFDSVTFQNYYDPEARHNGLVGGNAWLDNIWCRDCDFVGNGRWAVYLDGAHASGIIRSRIGTFGSGNFLFLSNNDFDLDVNHNDTFDPNEIRQANYIVIEGNTIEGGHTVVNLEGGHSLIRDNLVTGQPHHFVWQNSPESFRGVPLVDYYGNRIVGNQVDSVYTFFALNGAVNAQAQAGQYEVRNNTIWDMRGAFISESETVDGPNRVCGNIVSNSPIDEPCYELPPDSTPDDSAPFPAAVFPLGVVEDGNVLDHSAFGPMIDDLRAHHLDTVFFVNTWASGADILDISDAKGFDVYYNLNEVWEQWFSGEVMEDIDTARAIIHPQVDAVKDHPSLKGYNALDEPTTGQKNKLALAVQAYRERDPERKLMPTLIGIDRACAVFAAAQPDVMLLNVYPFSYNNPACDTTMHAFGYPGYDLVEYVRAIAQTRTAGAPLWVILQTHQFQDGSSPWHLREPTVAELREEHWLAIGEGATGIFWFLYSSEQGWLGLKDNPVLFTEVASLARRIGPLRGLLVSLHKMADQYSVTGSQGAAYVSTLTNQDGSESYLVIVNRECAPQYLTVTPPSGPQRLRDVETGELYTTGSALLLAGGDGRILQVLPDE